MKLVLDTNIYIAAFLNKGLASKTLSLGHRRKLDIYISEPILNELTQKLRGKFKLDQAQVKEFIDLITQATYLVTPQKHLQVVPDDPDDDKIIECAIEAKADIIISMDKHLLKLKKYQNIAIVHPKTLTWILPQVFQKQTS